MQCTESKRYFVWLQFFFSWTCIDNEDYLSVADLYSLRKTPFSTDRIEKKLVFFKRKSPLLSRISYKRWIETITAAF